MEIINALAGMLGISSGSLITIGVVGGVLLAILFAIRMVIKITMRLFAIGCVTIIGLVVGLYILFAVLR